MANNATGDNTKAIVPYSNEINECHLHIVFSIECIEAKVLLQKKLSKHTKHQKQVCYFMRNANAIMRNEIKLDQQKKESLLVALESNKSRMIDLKKQLLLAKEGRQNMIENIKINIKKYEDKWLTCKSRFESIHFIKRYFEVNDKIETVRGNISSLIIETKKLSNDINLKKTELINLGQKYIIELADYMIHQRPIILKLIDDKRNEIKKIVKEKENNNATVKNALLVSPPEKRTIKAKNVSDEDTEYLPKNEAHDTLVLPKLHLLNMGLVPIGFDQIQKVSYKNTAIFKRSSVSYSPIKYDVPKKAKVAENIDEVNLSPYFTSPTKIDQAKKYTDKKLIHILDDVKLDTTGTYKIISKINPYQLHDVNVIKAGASQQKEEEDKDKVIDQQTEEIEKIDLTIKVSQDVILPPTQFVDLERNSQEKRVKFNTDIMTIEDLPNSITGDTKSQEDDNAVNNTSNNELNASTVSDDSYNKIKDSVFKKHNLNLSPEFTYTKNTAMPMVTDKLVTSKFFGEKQKGATNIDYAKDKMEVIEILDEPGNKPENDIIGIGTEKTNQPNTTTDTEFEEGKESSQKDNAFKAGQSFKNFIQDLPDSLNISMNTTGYEDADAEFPQCIDSSLLLSPKADDEMQTSDNKVQVLSQEGPSFISGLRKTGFSFFGSTSSVNQPDSNAQNQSNNFNFNFGGDEKIKRSGLFSMFR
ncbi:uncharacterized protein LOC120628927 isoform X1 [Pararge aegeria]|uniref:uncharacterized protein LOC120628927 isoform X1 n=1 Tax=Pararge aegeria TaxID=116150 RepID=UPI0019D2A5FE|nr:uncharacterized protein LOC120628927 isoform X1 [Pararge aegeria]